MNRQHVIDNHIVDRYLLGKLSDDEKTEFEVFYLSCPDTQDELVVTEKILAGFEASAFAGRQRKREDSEVVSTVSPTRSTGWQLATAAASMVAAIAIGFNVTNSSSVDFGSQDLNVPIVSLGATRGDAAARLISLPARAVRVAVALDLGLATEAQYRVELRDGNDGVVWSADGLVPDEYASLTFTLPPGLLQAGDFAFVARGIERDTVALRVPVLVRLESD